MPLPGSFGQLLGEPGHALGAVAQLDRLEPQARPGQRSADDLHADAELLDDVGDDAVVRGGGGREDRDPLGQRRDEPADAPVVRPEVVAPVADAVRLVDHEQPDAAPQRGQHGLAEALVRQPLGRDHQDVDLVVGDRGLGPVPLLDVAGVDGHGTQAQAVRGAQLVAHEREQRADDERRPLPAIAQHPRREPVHEALAPPGPLHDERPPPGEHGLDRFALPLAEGRAGPEQPDEELVEVGLGGRGQQGHAVSSRSSMGSTMVAPRIPSRHSRGMPSMPQYRPARPPAMHAVVSVSWP